MNKFLKKDVLKEIDLYKEAYKKALEEEINKFLRIENAPVYTFFKRLVKKPLVTKEDAVNRSCNYGEFMQYYSITRNQQLMMDAVKFAAYVVQSKDPECVELTEQQYNRWVA